MWRIIAVCMMMTVLTSCGGQINPTPSQQDDVIPTATPFPTLIFEERVQYTAGFIENPFRLAIRPNDTIQMRILQILGASAQLINDFDLTTPLDRLSIEDITPIQRAFLVDFNVGLSQQDWDTTSTIGDLIALVQRRVGEQVALNIYKRTSLYFEVIFIDSYGDGLRALCESDRGVVTIPILDGMTMLVAMANDCGEPALQIAKNPDTRPIFAPISAPTPVMDNTPEADVTPEGDSTPAAEFTSTPDATQTPPSPEPMNTPLPLNLDELVTGTQGVWLIGRSLGTQNINVVANRPFCRLNIRDFYSWFLPNLLLEVARIKPLVIIDKATPFDLVRAIATDQCAGGMLSADQIASLDLTGVTLGQRSVTFPYGVVMYPLEVELGIQLRLNEVLPAMAQDPNDGRSLRLLIGQDALLPVTSDTFADLSRFIATTGYDLSQLGR